MTKRNGAFNENPSKKFKEDNIDALWGEDVDANDLEDCLLLATQMCEKNYSGPTQRNNVSTLPNYSFFKQDDDNYITSTQSNNFINNINSNKPAVSKFTLPSNNSQKIPSNIKELQKKVEKLENEHLAKEGEVTILRSQLKQIRVTLETELEKKEKEWTEKLQLTSKELISTQSELEFKNLEVANLKNKITEVTRNHGEINLNGTKTNLTKRNIDVTLKLNASLEEYYPLKNKIDPSIFTLSKQEYFYQDSNRTLTKFNNQNDQKMIMQYEVNAEYNNFKLDSVFPYISTLMNLSQADLNCAIAKEAIDKTLFAALEITKSFYRNLTILRDDVQEETIRQRDMMYLDKKLNTFCTDSSIFGHEEWYSNEIGIKSRRIIAVVAELLPYSTYLRQLILQKSIYSNESLENFFHLVQSVVKIIGTLRISERCVGFLCSVVIFITRATITAEFCNWYLCIGDISKEIILARPPKKTLEYLTEFLKQSTLHIDFVKSMCKMTQHQSYSTNGSEEVINYNEESCLLRVFTILYKENCIKHQTNSKITMAVLQFIKQVLKSNVLWTHFNNEHNCCNCLRKIVKLGIKVIHQIADFYRNESTKCLTDSDKNFVEDYGSVLKFSIDLLHIIKFKCMDVFNKNSTISQYKFIVTTLSCCSQELKLDDQERETLKELCLAGESQDVNYEALNKIPIWH